MAISIYVLCGQLGGGIINCIIDLLTKHIENLDCVRHYHCAEDSQTSQTEAFSHPPKELKERDK